MERVERGKARNDRQEPVPSMDDDVRAEADIIRANNELLLQILANNNRLMEMRQEPTRIPQNVMGRAAGNSPTSGQAVSQSVSRREERRERDMPPPKDKPRIEMREFAKARSEGAVGRKRSQEIVEDGKRRKVHYQSANSRDSSYYYEYEGEEIDSGSTMDKAYKPSRSRHSEERSRHSERSHRSERAHRDREPRRHKAEKKVEKVDKVKKAEDKEDDRWKIETAKRIKELEAGNKVEEEKDSYLTPFVKEIQNGDPYPTFCMPSLSDYSGNTRARTHVAGFEITMSMLTKSEAILCRAFASTLTDHALKWFLTQPTESITGYQDFKRKFLARFSASGAQPVRKEELCWIRQKAGEGIASYTERFMKVANQIFDIEQSIIITLYYASLLPGPLKQELGMRWPETAGELYERVRGYCAGADNDEVQ